MKIAAPVSHLEETEMLLQLGADELYGGVSAPEWEKVYGRGLWINRRSPINANLLSIEEVLQVTALAHAKAASVYITFNSPFYPQDSLNTILALCEKLVRYAHIDGLILADMNLLIAISREKLPVRIHLSSLAACINSESVAYYHLLGVNRVILPRHLILSEIESMVKNWASKMEFEVFAINDGCCFEEGFCQTSHVPGPFCMTDWAVSPFPTRKQEIANSHPNEEYPDDFREFLWYQNNCGCTFQTEGFPNGPCSLCWFGKFRDWGVHSVKIVGREASFYRKMRSLQLVREVMNAVRSGLPRASVAETAKKLRNTPQFCDKGYMCYFREY